MYVANSNIIAPNVKYLSVSVDSWNVDTIFLPQVEKLRFYHGNDVIPIFPDGVKNLFWDRVISGVRIPDSVETLYLHTWAPDVV